ncbi:MAG TPA: hypothetical protein ENK43_06320 [Planctomycetes bacterium]|nr:hypothetical protein [Planctomycetota bacterium]
MSETKAKIRERIVGWKNIAQAVVLDEKTVRIIINGGAKKDHPLRRLIHVDPLTQRPFIFVDELGEMLSGAPLYVESPPKVKPSGPGSRGRVSAK